MSHRTAASRLGISARVSMITLIVLIIIFAGMFLFIGERLRTDFREVQLELFGEEVAALRGLTTFQTQLVERIIRAHVLNPQYADALISEDYETVQFLLRILNTNLNLLDSALLVDNNGTVVAAADESHVGVDISGKNIIQQIEEGVPFPMDPRPTISPFTGSPVIYYGARIIRDREDVGALVVLLDLQVFSAIYISTMEFGETGYPYIVSNDGIMVAHPDSGLIGKAMQNEDFFKQMKKNREEQKLGDLVIDYQFNAQNRTMVYTPLSQLPWSVAMSMSRAEIQAPAWRTIRLIALIAVAGLIVVNLILVYFIRTYLIRRVHALAADLQVASSGDLSVRSAEKGSDEFSDISRRFNVLMESLTGLISGVRQRMEVLDTSGQDLSVNVQETAAAINQINANIESTRGQIGNQSVNITQTSATVEEMTKNIEALGGSIERQAESVSQSSTAVEEMVQSIRLISSTTQKASEEVRSLGDVSRSGKDQLDVMVKVINEISGMSEGLNEANTVIANIASQTNLLAMNAAIEAAHAGDAGAGFSVVADEIRNLAENASEQAKIVKGRLKQVTKSVQQIVDISSDTDTAFGRITGSIEGVQQVFEEIRSAMEEQSAGGEQLLGILSGMTQITDTVRSGSEEMNQGNVQILEVVTSLNSISEEVKNAIDEIARGTGEINRAVSNIVELSDENSESIQEVKREAASFALTPEEAQAAADEAGVPIAPDEHQDSSSGAAVQTPEETGVREADEEE